MHADLQYSPLKLKFDGWGLERIAWGLLERLARARHSDSFLNRKMRLWLHEKGVAGLVTSQSKSSPKKAWSIDADRQAHTKHTVPCTGVHCFDGSCYRKGKAGTHQCSKYYPQQCGDFCPNPLFLSEGAVFDPLPPHIAPDARRRSAIAFRLGVAFEL